MGKYMRKNKLDGEGISALMDVSPSSLGVLTRAKSLALQRRLQKPPPTSPDPPSKRKRKVTDSGGSYLQLRSRRLQKKPPVVVIRSTKQRRRKESCVRNPKSDSVAESVVFGKDTEFNGQNFLEFQGSQSLNRNTRESTPCTVNREAETNTSLGSSTKLNDGISGNSDQIEVNLSGNRRPTTPDMDRFFSGAEEEQQRHFIEKYNFDPVNEQPLPGRFEWEKVDN